MPLRFLDRAADASALRSIHARGDQIMAVVCWLLWVLSVAFAFSFQEWTACLAAGLPMAVLATVLCWRLPGALVTRVLIGVLFMGFSGLIIQESHGLIESHFAIFCLLAFLLYYRDWRPLAAGAICISAHHHLFCQLQMRGVPVYVFPPGRPCQLVWMHTAYIAAEAGILIYLGEISRREALEFAAIAEFGERLVRTGVIDLRGADESNPGSTALHELLVAIDGAVSQAVTVAQGIRSVSSDVTAVAGQVLNGAREQQSNSRSAVAAVREVAATVDRVTSNCKDVAMVARGSAESVEQGRQTMQLAAATMERLNFMGTDVMTAMTELQLESVKIEGTIRIIGEIAEQTDLLALNATIEAANAGEAGRGFQVIAHEIRELALRTRSSLGQVQEQVSRVQTQTNRVRALAGMCDAAARESEQQVEQAKSKLEHVVEQLPQIAHRTEEIVQQARLYTAFTEDAVRELQGIERMIVENATHMNRIDALGQSLEGMSLHLGQSVRSFRPRDPEARLKEAAQEMALTT